MTIGDRPNGDLKAGDRIMISSWCRDKTYVRVKASGGLISVGTTGDVEAENTQINRAFFGDVLEVLAVHYPRVLVDVHSVSAGPGDYLKIRTVLDAQDFECERADDAYIQAVMRGKPRPEPAAPPARPRPGLKSTIILSVLLMLAVFGVLELARLAGMR